MLLLSEDLLGEALNRYLHPAKVASAAYLRRETCDTVVMQTEENNFCDEAT